MLVIVGLILAFVLIVIFSNRETRQCRWRERRGEGESRFRCIQCGAETTGPRGTPPKTCQRPRS